MWQRLTLTLLLVASMARSSSSGSTMCPENCECTIVIISHHDDEIGSSSSSSNNNKSIEVSCEGAPIPRIDSLPENSQRLVIRGTKPHEIARMMLNLESTKNIALRELAIINSSLTSLNVTLSRVSRPGLEFPTTSSLNLSCNNFVETQELRVRDGDRLTELDLSENLLSRVRREAFAGYGELVKLWLRRNSIRTIEEDGFAGLGRLESLDLSENRLGALAEDTFVPLCYLKKLNLSGNRLGVLGDKQQWFENLGRSSELDVSRNENNEPALETSSRSEDVELSLVLGSVRRLEMIDASRIGLERVPSALTRSVRSLNLAGNRLTTIRGGDFDSYPLLRVLDLSSNLISIVENDALGRLEILERLDLTGNRLTELPQSLPAGLGHLVVRENLIAKLRKRDLEGLTNLRSLELNENDIVEIEEGSMAQLLLLDELDVSNNPIEQLPANTFGGPANLAILRMSGLSSLQWEREKPTDMAFPVPAPERLVELDLSASPALAAQLLADEAALSACKSLRRLNIARTNLTELRSDLPYLLPQLRTLGLSDNRWKCTSDDDDENRIVWLAKWIREHEETGPPAECTFYNGTRIILADLPLEDSRSTTTTTTTTTTIIMVEDLGGGSTAIDESRASSSEQQRITLGGTGGLGHPGILILACAILGALAAALSVAISRRRAVTIIDELDRCDQRRPIVTELW